MGLGKLFMFISVCRLSLFVIHVVVILSVAVMISGEDFAFSAATWFPCFWFQWVVSSCCLVYSFPFGCVVAVVVALFLSRCSCALSSQWLSVSGCVPFVCCYVMPVML